MNQADGIHPTAEGQHTVAATVYAALIAVAIVVTGWPYPFLPRNFTVIDTLTIGVPGFFLALAPNTRRYLPGFVDRVLRFAIPAGATVAVVTFVAYGLARDDRVIREARTAALVVVLIVGLYVLMVLARPFTKYRALLVGAMTTAAVLVVVVPWFRHFFALRALIQTTS